MPGKKELTKLNFVQSLVALTEQHHHFDTISVSRIAKQTGLNRQTFYYHFENKYDLLAFAYQQLSFKCLDVTKITLENWSDKVLDMLKGIYRYQTFFRVTGVSQQNLMMHEFNKYEIPCFYKLFNDIDPHHPLNRHDEIFYANLLSYGCAGLLIDWIQNGFDESPEEIATQLNHLLSDLKHVAPKL